MRRYLRKHPQVGYAASVLLIAASIGLFAWASYDLASEDRIESDAVVAIILSFVVWVSAIVLLQMTWRADDQADSPKTTVATYFAYTLVWMLIGGVLYAVTDATTTPVAGAASCPTAQGPGRVVPRPPDQRVTLTSDLSNQNAQTALTIATGRRRRPVVDQLDLDMSTPSRAQTAQPSGQTSGAQNPGGAQSENSSQTQLGNRAQRQAARRARNRLVVRPLANNQYVRVHASSFRRVDGAVIPRDAIVVEAQVVSETKVELRICLDPLRPREIDSGSYAGIVSITDPRTNGLDIPVEIRLHFNHWPILVLVLFMTFIVSAFIVWNGVRKLKEEPAGLRTRDFKDFFAWIRDNPVALGTGVAAGTTIFTARYINDSAWPGTISETIQLIGATGGAFVTATLIAAGVTKTPDRTVEAGSDVTGPADGVDDGAARDDSAGDSGDPWGDPDIGAFDLVPGRDFDPDDDPAAEGVEERPVGASSVPDDGVDDSRRDADSAGDAGDSWGDPEIGAFELVPGRDFDPDDDPDAQD